ncbi:hypothetical protein BU26DRAFT_44457 [Trematosphaeria pertusa]|uniref:Uncharacterized protein n=1 Tax=Trematosphaeria pertusa TaxID=390896 RepID=A0A6A6I826_9PLEO|nr:uncharacterized protein BU26DRAFT_44457 [Trematosphaeria pertusa]KAF2246369.1 hypothetical protein BU26DRAFT_44457 [Trematosphaeria pertusa]
MGQASQHDMVSQQPRRRRPIPQSQQFSGNHVPFAGPYTPQPLFSNQTSQSPEAQSWEPRDSQAQAMPPPTVHSTRAQPRRSIQEAPVSIPVSRTRIARPLAPGQRDPELEELDQLDRKAYAKAQRSRYFEPTPCGKYVPQWTEYGSDSQGSLSRYAVPQRSATGCVRRPSVGKRCTHTPTVDADGSTKSSGKTYGFSSRVGGCRFRGRGSS